MTIYLKFADQATALAALGAENYRLGANMCSGNGWGWMGLIPAAYTAAELAQIADGIRVPLSFIDGFHVNLNDCNELAASLAPYEVPAPLTPFNVVAGREVATVYRCVVVTAAIRDMCRAMVVQLAGDVHAGMWSQGLSGNGSEPAVSYINSGFVRVELAACLDDAQTLATATGCTLEQAQGLLAQADVSAEDPLAVMARMGLQAII